MPKLHEVMFISVESEMELGNMRPPRLEKLCFGFDGSKDSFNRLLLLKDICFSAPISTRTNDRCDYDSEDIHADFLCSTGIVPAAIFSTLADGTLQNFR